ncbi:MAG: hypothetical protein FRC53_06965 [Pseudoramibacter sp. EUB1.1]|uniref:Uncharacterized protein n=1 Tax=Candidatus Pseudoramibacter fermentans TaxID=2594427 RepID=A0A6L5GSB9_9FIRM|nr:hypothetical protein [Candidatus Pseudoramibacter fermentans]
MGQGIRVIKMELAKLMNTAAAVQWKSQERIRIDVDTVINGPSAPRRNPLISSTTEGLEVNKRHMYRRRRRRRDLQQGHFAAGDAVSAQRRLSSRWVPARSRCVHRRNLKTLGLSLKLKDQSIAVVGLF